MQYLKDDIEFLICQRLAGKISASDDRFLTDVLYHNHEMRELYEQLNTRLAGLNAIDENQAWQQVSAQLVRQKNTRKINSGWLAAAVLFLAVSAGIYFYYQPEKKNGKISIAKKQPNTDKRIKLTLDDGKTFSLEAKNQSIKTGQAEISTDKSGMRFTSVKEAEKLNTLSIPAMVTYQIKLADGTKVWLNSLSQLRFPFGFSGKTREVYVRGEAYFEVKHNPAKPFIVHTPQTKIVVKGTSFNVNAYEAGHVVASLVEGRIVTSAKNGSQLNLMPGSAAVFDQNSGFYKENFNPNDVLSWMNGLYLFHDTSLHDLIPVIKRWYDLDVEFLSAKTASHKISGVIEKDQPIQQFLDNLQGSTTLKTSVKDGKIFIR